MMMSKDDAIKVLRDAMLLAFNSPETRMPAKAYRACRDALNHTVRSEPASVTLTAFQLREALDFIAPERDTDPQQWESDLTFGIVRHQDDDGKDLGLAMCCWNDDTDGVMPLADEYVAPKQIARP